MSVCIIAVIATLFLLAIGSAVQQQNRRSIEELDRIDKAKRELAPEFD